MGGYGSGPRRAGGKKWTVEECLALDTTRLLRWGIFKAGLRSGEIHWGEGNDRSTVEYETCVNESTASIRLKYKMMKSGERCDYRIRLLATPCHYGSVRWWFICPLSTNGRPCGRRARKVFRAGRYFGCRHCHRLSYTSTQQSDQRVYAAVRRGFHLQPLDNVQFMSVNQLGFALKVFRHIERKNRPKSG